jgi:uncharacterized damage-inducible protein DinB
MIRTPEAPMDAVLPYRAMAYNNGWANHRLLAACVRLSHADFVATRSGFFPSLRATLNHILIIDRFYVDAMEGGTLGPAAWADREPCETAITLRDAQQEADCRLIAVVDRLGPVDLDRIVDVHRGDRTQRERLDRLLLHLFQHQIHHRGQAHGMLSGTEVRPPQLDEFFAAEEASLRAAEFAELGWTEDAVWAR